MKCMPFLRRLPAVACAALLLPLVGTADLASLAQDDDARAHLDESRDVRRQGNVEGVSSQKRVDQISSEIEALFTRYTNALRNLESTQVYNRQMVELIGSQDAEIVSLRDQLNRSELVGRSVTPLMLRMIAALAAFVELDIPFLEEERAVRIASLRALSSRADVTRPAKYRQIMEAYQIENEYGRTIEAYRGTLDRDGREITVNFLRFGRIALMYQTLDESEAGVWNAETRSWTPLDSSYRSAIRIGIRIARKQAAPDLIHLPLLAAKDAEGQS